MADPLTLPEEFALLSLAETGRMIDSDQARVGCTVAELGELALRGKLLLRQRERPVLGLNAIRAVSQVIELVDAARVGLAWADDLPAELANETGPVTTLGLLRRNAFLRHRGTLVAHGRPGPVRAAQRAVPEGAISAGPGLRNRLIDEVRLAAEVARDAGGAGLANRCLSRCGTPARHLPSLCPGDLAGTLPVLTAHGPGTLVWNKSD